MKALFENIATELEIPLIYAQRDLSNIQIDQIAPEDYSADGLLLLVTPLRSSLVLDIFNRVRSTFEVGVLILMDIDYNEEEMDEITTKATDMLKRVAKRARGTLNTVNIIDNAYDANMGGVYANITIGANGNLCINYEE